MNGVDDKDQSVVRICAYFEVVLARFAADCRLVENAEFQHEEIPGVQEARAREQGTIHEMEALFEQIGQLAIHTNFGALAKMRVLQRCLEYGLAGDKKVAALVNSLVRDLDKAIHDDPDCSCHLRPSALSANLASD